MSLYKDLRCFTRINLSDHSLRTTASALEQFLGLGSSGYQPLIQSNKRGSSPEISFCEYEYLLHQSVCTQHRSPHNPAGTGHQTEKSTFRVGKTKHSCARSTTDSVSIFLAVCLKSKIIWCRHFLYSLYYTEPPTIFKPMFLH